MSRAVRSLLLLWLGFGACACTLDFGRFTAASAAGNTGGDGGSQDGGASRVGTPCSPDGSRDCDGHASVQPLLCRSGKWRPAAACADGERCDTRAGATLGQCVAVPPECTERIPGEAFCDGDSLRTCGPDLISFDEVSCAPGGHCNDGGSGARCDCDPGYAPGAAGGCVGGGDGGADGGGQGGDASAGGGGDAGPVNAPPDVEVMFPRPGLTDRAAITVRGVVSDPEGDPIAELRVNDALAQVGADGRFSVSAPLELGRHALNVHVQDARGASADIASVELERLGYMFQHAADMVLDAANQRVIAVDDATDAVVAISTTDGSRSVIVPPVDNPVGRDSLALDAANDRVLVAEHNPGALAWIDLATGTRTLVSDATHGSGDAIVPRAPLLDPSTPGRAFVLADGANSNSGALVYAVDLASGNRTPVMVTANNWSGCIDLLFDQARNRLIIVSSDGLLAVAPGGGTGVVVATGVNRAPAVGSGSPLFNPAHGALDGDRALLSGGQYAGNGAVAIHAVDLVSGNHQELAALTLGGDPTPLQRYDTSNPFAYDPATGLGWVLDSSGRLLSVRLQPGDREYFSDVLYGQGPSFYKPLSIADDATRNRWVVADTGAPGVLMAVDKKSGDRTPISSDTRGTGDAFNRLAAVAVDSLRDRLIALDADSLYAVDPVSGDRSVIARDTTTGGVGSGAAFAGATSLVMAADGVHAMVAGCSASSACGGQVVAIDLVTDATQTPALSAGKRTVFSSQNGTPIQPLLGIAVAPQANTGIEYLAITSDSLFGIDLNNGSRTLIAGPSTGSGPALTNPVAVAFDAYEGRAIVLNDHGGSVVAVDLDTGDRSPVSDQSANAGPYPSLISGLIADDSSHALLLAEGWGDNDAGLVEVQLCDRKRSLVSDQARGEWNAVATVLDAPNSLLYAGQSPLDVDDATLGAKVLALDTRTGNVGVISDDADDGGSPRWKVPIALALDPGGGRLLGASLFYSTPNPVLAIELGDGTQSVLSDSNTGAGVAWQAVFDLAWDGAHDRALAAALGLPGIIAIDPASGDRVVLSGGPNGAGTALTGPRACALDASGNRLVTVDGTELIAIDLESGDRSPLSGASAGSGPALIAPQRVVLDQAGSRAIVLDIGDSNTDATLVAVDLSDGTRSTLATLPRRWYGTSVLVPPSIAFDGASSIAYLGPVTGLFALDPSSGDYVLMAGYGD